MEISQRYRNSQGVFNQVNWFEVKDLVLELHGSSFCGNYWVWLCQI